MTIYPFFRPALAALLFLLIIGTYASATSERSTNDLHFLVGTWSVRWTYSPNTDRENVVDGQLVCEPVLNDKHVFCRYRFEREDAPTIVEHVYFNYNAIYKSYEAVWVSGTWPIKVLMSGDIHEGDEQKTLSMFAEFSIGNDMFEQVKSSLRFESGSEPIRRFERTTHVRVSNSSEFENVDWNHHMTEVAERTDKIRR